jgi:formyl-CoA transferase
MLQSTPPLPLAGVKVVELGQLIAGPFAGKTLADFGAELVKIEPPGEGDPLRTWRLLHKGTSVWWQVQSRNKQSVALDLRQPQGQEIARRLIREADVVIENFRPGTLEVWGLGWDDLSRLNPGLIMLRISGYGQTGPYRDRPGFGVIGEAMGGLRHITGEPGCVPVRVGVSIGDSLASLHGVIGVLMALYHRKVNGGQGQYIDWPCTRPCSTCWRARCRSATPSGRSASGPGARCPASPRPTPIRARTASTSWWRATAIASSSG